MKAVFAAGISIAILAGVALTARRTPAIQSPGPRVPVLAELFTSEGCSSCPPADELLRQLISDQPIDGVEVIGLSEHVDYWDRLGWKDPFSSARFTARQQAYARVFGTDRIYTPQLVVNGSDEVVGSDARAARRALLNGAKRARAAIDVTGSVAMDVASIRAAVHDVPQDAGRTRLSVVAAVVEDDLASEVTRGENARRRLRHAAVTRFIDDVGALDAGSRAGEFSRTVPLAADWRRDRLRLVVFLQNPSTLRVVGAAATPLRAPRE